MARFGRQGDALINGVLTEFKTLNLGANSGTIMNVLGNSKKGIGQGRNVVFDTRGKGLSLEEALLARERIQGSPHMKGKIKYVGIIMDDRYLEYYF